MKIKNKNLSLGLFKNKKGMTLVEALLAVTIVGTCAGMLAMGFGTSFNLIRRGVDTEKDAAKIFADIEQYEGTAKNATLTFSKGANSYWINGVYVAMDGGDASHVKYCAFKTN